MNIEPKPQSLATIQAEPLRDVFANAGIPAPGELPVLPEDFPIVRVNGTNELVYRVSNSFLKASFGHLDNILPVVGIPVPEEEELAKAFKAAIEQKLLSSETVDYAGAIAGCRPGKFIGDGIAVLATKDSGWIEPTAGNWENIQRFLEALFQDAFTYVLAWLAVAMSELRRCREVGPYEAKLLQHQALIIVGPPGCGKSLFKSLIVNLLGGKMADPFPFFSGATRFSDDLVAAPLLVMDDATESINKGYRRRLTQALKKYLVNRGQRIEEKGKAPVFLTCYQRVMILANEDSVETLPLVTESMLDKLFLLQAHPSTIFADLKTADAVRVWTDSLFAEVPAFASYLLNEHHIAEELRDSRYGVKAFHDAGIKNLTFGVEEVGLLDKMIRFSIARDDPRMANPVLPNMKHYTFCDTARTLLAKIQKVCHPTVVRDVANVLALGKALSQLCVEDSTVYRKVGVAKGYQKWRIEFELSKEDFFDLGNIVSREPLRDAFNP